MGFLLHDPPEQLEFSCARLGYIVLCNHDADVLVKLGEAELSKPSVDLREREDILMDEENCSLVAWVNVELFFYDDGFDYFEEKFG
jgi:hypothetical protein